MSRDREDPVLLGVAATIADGHPVDWDGLRETHPSLQPDLVWLRLLESIASRAAGQSGAGE